LVAGSVPHFADDLEFCARFERMGARPSAAAALVCNLATADVRPLLDKITAPTLVVYSGTRGGLFWGARYRYGTVSGRNVNASCRRPDVGAWSGLGV
jgi:hypothetical protein